MWPWSLTGYSSGCLYWCVYWDLWDSFFLLGWLEWSRTPSLKGRTILPLKRKRDWYFIFTSCKWHVSVLAQVIRRLPTEKQDEISLIDSIHLMNSLWGQKANSPSPPLHFDIELCSSRCHLWHTYNCRRKTKKRIKRTRWTFGLNTPLNIYYVATTALAVVALVKREFKVIPSSHVQPFLPLKLCKSFQMLAK